MAKSKAIKVPCYHAMPATRATCVRDLQDLKKLHPETDSVVPTPSGPSIKTRPSDTQMKR